MIDMVFLLLFFFMCAATLSQVDASAPLELATAQEAARAQDRADNIVNIMNPENTLDNGDKVTAAKPYLVNGHLVDEVALRNYVAERLRRGGSKELCLRIDRRVRFAQVRRAIRACAEVGASDLVFSVYPSSAN